MTFWRQVDANGNFINSSKDQDAQPGPDWVEAVDGWFGDTFKNGPESEGVKAAKRYAGLSPDEKTSADATTHASVVNEAFADQVVSNTNTPQYARKGETVDLVGGTKTHNKNFYQAYTTADGSPVWRLASGTDYTPPSAAKQGLTFEQEKILKGMPTSSSSFGVSEVGPVAAQLRREESAAAVEAARVKATADLRVSEAAILKGEEETAIAKRNEAFAIDKDGYARSVDNVKLQREAQSELFKQQTEVARLTAEQVGLVARRDEAQASLDQAVNLANLSAEQRGKEFNVTQEFNVQRANEEAARARQQQLQTLGTDIGKLGADSGDRGKYAATILANSGWGQADRALAGANMNTTASLSPLEALLRQRETVQNLSDKPYTYTPTTISTAARTQMGPVDFSRMQMPTAQPLAAFTSPGRYVPTTQTTAQPPNAAPASSGASTSAPSAPSAGSSAPMPSNGAGAGATETGTRPSYGALSDPGDMGGVRTDAGFTPGYLAPWTPPTSGSPRLNYAEQDAAARASLAREQNAGRGAVDEGDTGGVRTDAAYVNSLAASGEAYGTKGTKEREFITGDPQRNGKPNPELVRVNNPGPQTRVEVIPLQGNGDMNMTSMYAQGTDTGFMTADGRKRGPLEVLQRMINDGVAPQKAMDMINALGFDSATGGWKEYGNEKPVAKEAPMPTGPAALFTEGATEGNPRAKVPPKRGVDEGDAGGVRTDAAYANSLSGADALYDTGDTGGVRADEDYLNRNKRPTYAEQDELARKRLAQEQRNAVDNTPKAARGKSSYDVNDELARMELAQEQQGAIEQDRAQKKAAPRRSDTSLMSRIFGLDRHAYGTEGAEGAGDGLNLIMAALQNNPAALAAFMELIGQGQEAPSFPA